LLKREIEEYILRMKKISKVILIISTVFFALAIIPGIWIAVMSVMLFDSETSNNIFLLFSFISTFPLVCLFSFSSWIFYAYKKYGIAIFISTLPLINIICSGVIFFILS